MKIGLQTWGSDGDIRPFLALAGGLRARGHAVSLVVTSVDNKDYSSYGREMDFPISQVGQRSYDGAFMDEFKRKILATGMPLKHTGIILDYLFNPVSPEMFGAAEQLCRDHDIIIGHFVLYPVQAAAEKAGKPYATVMLNHLGISSKHSTLSGCPDLGTWMNPVWWRMYHILMDRLFGPEVNKLRAGLNLPRVKKVMDSVLTSGRLNLLAVSRAICERKPDWQQRHQVCGFLNVPDAAEKWFMPEDLKKFLGSGPPPIYMTLGSMFSYDTTPGIITKTLIQAALHAECRAIIQAPWGDLREIPDHPDIYKIRKTPHQYIFPHCAAIVHHGGAGTTHSATLHGCPSIVIEHFVDQGFFAGELERLGLAPKVLHRRTVTTAKLARAIRTVLDTPAMKKRAGETGASMKKEDGVRKAVELIENTFGQTRMTEFTEEHLYTVPETKKKKAARDDPSRLLNGE